MASNASGDLFIFTDQNGETFVSSALPTGVVIPASAVRQVRYTGPKPPVGWPRATKVGNLEQWLKEREAEGFEFTDVSA